MRDRDLHFEWDATKALLNLRKHGVAFRTAISVFADSLALTIFDPDHSTSEEPRWITVGIAVDGTCVLVVHTWQDVGPNAARVRIISARKATGPEMREYEETP